VNDMGEQQRDAFANQNEKRAIIIEHSRHWSDVVGPFKNLQAAVDWLNNHRLILEADNAKCKIVHMETPR